METQKIVNLLNDSDNESSRYATRKWYIINDQNERGNENDSTIKSETKIIKPNLCNYSDAYIQILQILLQILMLHLKIVRHLQDV